MRLSLLITSPIMSLIVLVALAGCSTKSFEPTSESESQDVLLDTSSESKTTPSGLKSDLTPFPKLNCAAPDKSLRALADWQETNLSALKQLKDANLIENDVRLTSAGLLSDELPFVALDRDCWSEFFTAFSNSLDKSRAPSKQAANAKRDETQQAASAWLTCIEARHPALLEEAKKIRSCFP